MRHRTGQWHPLKNNAFRVSSTIFLFWMFVLTGWLVACQPTAVDAPAATQPNQPYTVYLYNALSENDDANRLTPLDPETLNDQSENQSMELGRSWQLSNDGSTLVNAEYLAGRAGLDPEDVWITVYDFQSGVERGRYHPPVRGLLSAISADGTRLLLQPDPYTLSQYPPSVEWHVLDSATGEVVGHIEDDNNACFRQRAYFDAAGARIYCVVDPALSESNEPQPMQIVAYDVESGRRTGEIELPDILIGSTQTKNNEQLRQTFTEPAVELSPDGKHLIVVAAEADKVLVLDAPSLTIAQTVSFKPQPSVGLLERFGLVPTAAYAKGEMEGTIRQAAVSTDGRYLYLFSQVLWTRPEDQPEERGLWLVDLEQGRFITSALPEYQIQWVQPAPDGTVYLFGTTDERLLPYEIRPTSPSMLWRLDGRTLEVLAERSFTGFRQARVIREPTEP